MRIAICENDANQAQNLSQMLERHFSQLEQPVRIFGSGEALIEMCGTAQQFDMVFLDIQMGGMSGVEVLKQLQGPGRDEIIVMVSAFCENVPECIQNKAFTFLPKPYTEEQLGYVLSLVEKEYAVRRSTYTFRRNWEDITVKTGDILYLSVQNRTVIIRTKTDEYQLISSLKNHKSKLPANRFAQPHHAFLVNLGCVVRIDNDEVLLNEGTKIPLSKNRKKEFTHHYLAYKRGQM